jgi:hypothetical protein
MMKSAVFSSLLLVSLSLAASGAYASGERAGDFALLDHRGTFHQLSYYGDQAAVVLVAHSQKADAAQLAPPDFLLDVLNGASDVVFLYINAMADETRLSLADDPSAAAILVDESQMVATSLGLTRVGETIIIDPETMSIKYRGQASELSVVLPKILSGEPVAGGAIGTGTAIAYSAPPQHISYSRDIAPILVENCVSCHRAEGIAPWSMSSHAMVKGWSPMMREVVQTRRMPPGQVDMHVGKPLLEVAGLTADEHRKLIRWIDAGAPFDDDAGAVDPLAKLEFPSRRFALGEPDLVYRVTAQQIPETGVLDYRYVPLNLKLDRDVWVRAIEFLPGDPEVLHHVIAYVSSPADKSVRGRQTGAGRGESVGGFAPGRQPDQFRDNSGRLVRKGSSLLLQMHYTTAGRVTVDKTEIGIYLHDRPPAYVMSGGVAGERRFMVPPHAREHKLEGVQEIKRDAWLYGMNPHMHSRGKYMNYTAVFPDGRSEMLLSVPKYDFNWQFSYDLQEPLFLPAGTRLIARGAMDNSARNAGNPDPSMPVHFGLQTKHEMFFGFTTLRYVGDKPHDLAATKPAPHNLAATRQ